LKEIVVILAGVALGAGAAQIDAVARRAIVVVVGAVVIGTAWSRIVGEHELLALWDIAQALVAAVATVVLVRRLVVARRI
jgi:hypothetical protein